jgi:hypothetical protein
MIARLLILSLTLMLAGCDLEALMADPKAVQKEADSKAIGSGCRHGLRSLEDCYAMNDKASKAAIFAGWRDMDQYMRDNKIDGVEPKGLKPSAEPGAPVVASDEEVVDTPKAEKKPAKGKTKAAEKS